MSETVRIDRWLTASRMYKSRTGAQEACAASHVKLNGKNARASQAVKVGDRIEARCPRGDVILVVLALADKRQSPPKARELYEDHTPPPEEKPRDLHGERERGMGRPTKADRRRMERFPRRLVAARLVKREAGLRGKPRQTGNRVS